MQPSTGYSTQVVKIVVPYCRIQYYTALRVLTGNRAKEPESLAMVPDADPYKKGYGPGTQVTF